MEFKDPDRDDRRRRETELGDRGPAIPQHSLRDGADGHTVRAGAAQSHCGKEDAEAAASLTGAGPWPAAPEARAPAQRLRTGPSHRPPSVRLFIRPGSSSSRRPSSRPRDPPSVKSRPQPGAGARQGRGRGAVPPSPPHPTPGPQAPYPRGAAAAPRRPPAHVRPGWLSAAGSGARTPRRRLATRWPPLPARAPRSHSAAVGAAADAALYSEWRGRDVDARRPTSPAQPIPAVRRLKGRCRGPGAGLGSTGVARPRGDAAFVS